MVAKTQHVAFWKFIRNIFHEDGVRQAGGDHLIRHYSGGMSGHFEGVQSSAEP